VCVVCVCVSVCVCVWCVCVCGVCVSVCVCVVCMCVCVCVSIPALVNRHAKLTILYSHLLPLWLYHASQILIQVTICRKT